MMQVMDYPWRFESSLYDDSLEGENKSNYWIISTHCK